MAESVGAVRNRLLTRKVCIERDPIMLHRTVHGPGHHLCKMLWQHKICGNDCLVLFVRGCWMFLLLTPRSPYTNGQIRLLATAKEPPLPPGA